MAEITTPRLMAAAKEFNVGKETLVDFLAGKGFSKDDLKPTAKLTEEMYRALQAEFQSDKVAKLKSEQIDLPKGATSEGKRKRDEEEITFRKDEKKITKKEEPGPAPLPIVAEVIEPPVIAEPPPVPEPQKIEQPELVKMEIPEIEAPKVLDKIDLSAIDSSTRPKKAAKKSKNKIEEIKVEEEVLPDAEVPTEVIMEAEVPTMHAEPEVQETDGKEETPLIENIQAEKIEGPKIFGKIDLPVENDTRPKIDEKRKRKRIPIEKKDGGPQGFQRGGQQGGGGQSGGFQPRPAGSGITIQPRAPGSGGATQGGGGRFTPSKGRGQGGNRFGNQGGGGNRFAPKEDKQIDEKEIQRRIQETQAKLSGGTGRGKNIKAKLRREKRQELADA